MGNTSFNKDKCGAQLRQAITRMNIHRQKKLNKIAKQKDDICNHLNAQNEINAKIWAETLINDENQIPCYDIACTMCDQIRGRLEYMAKFGPPKDMHQTFATVIHLAPKLAVEEMEAVRKQLIALLGDEFAMQADEDKKMINPVVAENIDFIKPDDGQVVYRLRQIAKERSIDYQPSMAMRDALNSWCDRKGLVDPMDDGSGGPVQSAVPQYNPQIPPAGGPPPNNGMGPPPGGMPPGGMPPGGMPPGGPPGGGGQMYMPQQPPMQPMQPMQPQMYMPQQPMMPPGQAPMAYNPAMDPQQMNPMPPQQPPSVGLVPDPNPGPMDNMPPNLPPAPGMGGTANGPPANPPAGGGGQGEMDSLEARLKALENL